VKVKGPAIELSLGTAILAANCFYSDFAFAIKCSQWPDTASDWTNRPNKLWPDPENIARIASYGCYIVPKSQPGDKEGLTWRISFSKAEVEFSKLIPKIPQMCVMGLKVISKDYLCVVCDKINSYQLKCKLLHTLEKTNPRFLLQESNLTMCFHILLRNLLNAVITKCCPHFWIPRVSTFLII